MTAPAPRKGRVAVVGGGLAGLAASCALADSGFQITLFERRPFLGGRASSYQHPGTGEVVDNCQHVLLGCCTNLIDFYSRLGVADKIRWYDALTFLEPGGRASVIGASWLPAPLHTAPAFLRAACLDLRDKLAIATAMATLAQSVPTDNGDVFLAWLQRHRQTERAIERFWKTILISALNEDLNRMSVSYAAQVVRESFLKSAAAGLVGVPTVPLTELYGTAQAYISARGGEVRLRSGVDGFRAEPGGVTLSVGGNDASFDFAVLAASFDVLPRLLPQTSAAEPLRESLAHFASSPITGIHLWFDRQISDLDHAVLLDRTIQWMFHKSKLLNGTRSAPEPPGSYVELVVSSSKSLVEKSRQEIIDLALKELREFFPGARDANLVKATVIKEVHATYSPQPGVDAYRPPNETVWPRVFLAGDWTATGWPATMEGAVRSGYQAAACIARVSGLQDAAFLQPDLPAAGFMRLFG
jgi:squalene-associated FAD-dependent desaturase